MGHHRQGPLPVLREGLELAHEDSSKVGRTASTAAPPPSIAFLEDQRIGSQD
jgi:hypothetical protein